MANQEAQKIIGSVLPGGYRIYRFIGSGAFAWVYLAKDRRGTPVALKLLQDGANEAAQRLFLREIKVLRALPASTHCVKYVGDGTTEEGQPFLVMEYVDGCTVKDAFKFQPVWPESDACDLMLQLCDALSGLHRLGLAHRDLKPENIMLTRTWQVKVMDFGLVKDAQGLLKLFEEEDILEGSDFAENVDKALVAGTPEYMAPEQLTDPMAEDESQTRTDTWTDVYCLGLIFFEVLTGRKLFPFHSKAKDQREYARDLLAYIRNRTNMTDEALTRPKEISSGLWPVLVRALRHNPKQRQGSAQDLARDLRRYVEHGSIGEDFSEDERTSAADMSTVLSLLNTDSERPAVTDSGAHAAARPRSDAKPGKLLDVGAVQAYREQKLNAPNGADYTLPPGSLHASAVLGNAPQHSVPPKPMTPSIAPPETALPLVAKHEPSKNSAQTPANAGGIERSVLFAIVFATAGLVALGLSLLAYFRR